MLADLKNAGASYRPLLSGQATHVPHRSVNSYRETSSPRSAPHETNSVAPEKSLEDLKITGKCDPDPKQSAPTIVALRGKFPSRLATTPTPCHARQIFTDASRKGCVLT